MQVLRYNDLNTCGLEQKIGKIKQLLAKGDFRAADAKKMVGSDFYRARLDDTNRLLFKFAHYNDQKAILLLEVIRNHRYDISRFLRGVKIDPAKIEPVVDLKNVMARDCLKYLHPNRYEFSILDKILVFDDDQELLYNAPLPLVIIGSAGSGKTAITLEKMKKFEGDLLYITQSPYLVDNSRTQYYANHYENDRQDVTFYTFEEYLQSYAVPAGKEVTFGAFAEWFKRHQNTCRFATADHIFEEFKGVLTGSIIDKPYLARDDYLTLGIKQSIFLGEQRNAIYDLFERYVVYLKENQRYDINILSYDYLPRIEPIFDAVVIDEVQDLTTIQLHAILKSLKQQGNFILCGDSNQIVHPNFFSWSKVKSLFYQEGTASNRELIRVLSTNYRSSKPVTEIANRLLKIKNARFGSIDRESNYLIKPLEDNAGEVSLFGDKDRVKREINEKTKRSTKYAILVMRDEDKAKARSFFQTPLIFSVREAKGLEYEHVVLYNVVTNNRREFAEIINQVSDDQIKHDELTYMRAKDKSDKSLEIYKFYINALYVAMSRSIKNLFLIEHDYQHDIFSLLGLSETQTQLEIKQTESSREEWQREARKLELQGKKEQAAEIRREILQTEPVPWEVLNTAQLEENKNRAFQLKAYDKKAQRLVFAYGLTYHDSSVFPPLMEARYSLAAEPEKGQEVVMKRFTPEIASHDGKDLAQNVKRYGIDYRNQLGQTPLIAAVRFGRADYAAKLIQDGADPESCDFAGDNSFEIALRESCLSKPYATSALPQLYNLLAPHSLKLKIGDRMIKLDKHSMEYFLFTLMQVNFFMMLRDGKWYDRPGFQTANLLDLLGHIPESILPEKRKTRTYLSSILAKNEVFREGKYNRHLFYRVFRGHYWFNPMLEVARGEGWISIYDYCQLDLIEQNSRMTYLVSMIKQMKKLREELPTQLLNLQKNQVPADPIPETVDEETPISPSDQPSITEPSKEPWWKFGGSLWS